MKIFWSLVIVAGLVGALVISAKTNIHGVSAGIIGACISAPGIWGVMQDD